MNDDRRYLTWEQRAVDDPRYRPGGEFGPPIESAVSSRLCGCGKTVFVDGFGAPASTECPQCGDVAAEVVMGRRISRENDLSS